LRRAAAAVAVGVAAAGCVSVPRGDPAPGVLAGRVIVLDPGHGGSRAGTVSLYGLREADVNLDVARRVAARLRAAGATVHLTRDADIDLAPPDSPLALDLAARAALADSVGADLLVSIHHNATAYRIGGDGLPPARDRRTAWYVRRETRAPLRRTEVYWKALEGADGPSRAAAEALAPRLAEALGTGEGVAIPGNFYLLRTTSRPAVLGEAAYLSHVPTARRLRWTPAREREVAAYVAGLAAYFAGPPPPAPPPIVIPPPETAPRTAPRVLVQAEGPRAEAGARAFEAALRARGAEVDVVGATLEAIRVEYVRRPDLVVSLADEPPATLADDLHRGRPLILHYPSSAKGRAAAERAAAATGGVAREASAWILAHTASPAVQIIGDADWESVASALLAAP
jgi:N-acetylmuramoyl-L-alanine amidase